MKTINRMTACALLIAVAGCSTDEPPADFSVALLTMPTPHPATSPRLATGSDDQLILSWLQTDGDSAALRYARFVDGAWAEAATVTESSDIVINWADLPSVVPLGDGHLAAQWLVMSGTYSHAYDIAVAESRDAGATWSPATTPHTDGTDTEHGFVSIYPAAGTAGLLWLDGRKMVNEVTDDPVASGMTLRSNEGVVDELVCDCCQTDVAVAASGPIAVYRDRSVDEIRDIYVTRQIDGHWQAGVPVAIDNWQIDGCPVNGPSITANGERVAVAWFTAAAEPLVQVAVSTDSGASFATPIEVVRGATLGRVAVAMLDDGDVVISWLASADPGFSEVRARRISHDGSLGPIRLIGQASGLSVPQMRRIGAQLVFAWTESQQDGAHVATATVAISAL
ncbi:MAG: sialidase family protein [Proteobacteria bacterium]|nr:sialidase family protein [Pseudomonadota bacterium]